MKRIAIAALLALTLCVGFAHASTDYLVVLVPGSIPGVPFPTGFNGMVEVWCHTTDPVNELVVTVRTTNGHTLTQHARVNASGDAMAVFPGITAIVGQPVIVADSMGGRK